MKKLITFVVLVIAAISVNAQKVKVKADPSVDLSKYKTYSWAGDMTSPNPIIHQIIIQAVEGALAAKGFTKVASNGDVTIVARALTESDMHISHPSWMPAMNSINTGIAVGSSSWPVTEGTLVVSLVNGTNDSIWRATATDTLEHGPSGSAAKDASRVEKKIRKSVDKMFKKFPRA